MGSLVSFKSNVISPPLDVVYQFEPLVRLMEMPADSIESSSSGSSSFVNSYEV